MTFPFHLQAIARGAQHGCDPAVLHTGHHGPEAAKFSCRSLDRSPEAREFGPQATTGESEEPEIIFSVIPNAPSG